MLHTILTTMLIACLSVPNASSLVDVAAKAGHGVSARVFQAQETADAEQRCQAEADRERQLCLQDGRDNCDELYETHFAVCLATPPPAESAERSGAGNAFMWLGIAGAAVLVLMLLRIGTSDEYELGLP